MRCWRQDLIWDHKTGKLQSELTGHVDSVTSVVFSPDSASLYSGSKDATIRSWNLTTFTPEELFRGHSGVTSVAISRDGVTIAAGSLDRIVRIWNAASGDLSGPFGRSRCRASGSRDRTIRIWNPNAGRDVDIWESADVVLCTRFSPNGEYIVLGTANNTVCIWETTNGELKSRFHGHSAPILAVAYSPDGRYIASGSKDNRVCIWEVTDGKEKGVLEGHDGWVEALEFSQDGAWLASGSSDMIVRLWNPSNTELKASFSGHKNRITSLPITPSLDQAPPTELCTFGASLIPSPIRHCKAAQDPSRPLPSLTP